MQAAETGAEQDKKLGGGMQPDVTREKHVPINGGEIF